MINKIGVVGNVNVVSRPSFKSEEAKANVTVPEIEAKASDAIANYGMAAVKMVKKFDVKPLEPIMVEPNLVHTIKGERIYTSDGRLYYIVDENEKTKTKVKLLNEDEVLKEIARISSGNITDVSINHAKELRKSKIAS